MTNNNLPQILMIPQKELEQIKKVQNKILEKLEQMSFSATSIPNSPYITAIEFMDAVRIRRSKFDQLIEQNKIETVKKGRKIYVLSSEVERYFTSPDIK